MYLSIKTTITSEEKCRSKEKNELTAKIMKAINNVIEEANMDYDVDYEIKSYPSMKKE